MSILTKKIASEKIDVFPAGFRGSNFTKSKLTTEENLTHIAVRSFNKENNNQIFIDPYDSSKVIIYLKGYYFNLPIEEIPAHSGKPLYAFIRLDEKTDNSNIGSVLINAYEDGDKKLLLDHPVPNDEQDPSHKYDFSGLGFCDDLIDLNDKGNCEYVQVRDGNGNILPQNLKLDSTEVRAHPDDNEQNPGDPINKNIHEIFGTEKLRAKRITFRGKRSDKELLKIDNNFTVVDKDEKTEYTVDIDANLNIGSDQASGTVNLTSAGSGATTIIGPNGGQIKLPANATSDNMIFIQNTGVPGWHKFSKANDANTIVCRDRNDIKTGTLNDVFIKIESSTIPTVKAVAQLNPDTGNYSPIITGVNDDGSYKFQLTAPFYPRDIIFQSGESSAKIRGKVEIDVDTQLDAPVKVKLSDTTGISVQYPGSDGASFTVKPGIININAQAPDGKATGLGVTRAFITVGEECDLAFNSKFTVAANSEVLVQAPITIDKALKTYVPLTIGNSSNTNASVTIKSAGSNQTTIIGSNNGEIYLPDSKKVTISKTSDKKYYIWSQSRYNTKGDSSAASIDNNWLVITDTDEVIPNAIVKTNADGKIVVPVGGIAEYARKSKIVEDNLNSEYPLVFADTIGTSMKDGGMYRSLKVFNSSAKDAANTPVTISANPHTGNVTANSFNLLKLERLSGADHPFKISGGVGGTDNYINIGGYIKISGGTTSEVAQLTVTKGNLHLPANSSEGSRVLVQATAGTSSWCAYSSSDLASTFMYRNEAGKSAVKGFTITGLKSSKLKSATIKTTGEVDASDLTVANPATGSEVALESGKDKYSFIQAISQSSEGKITPTRCYLPYANESGAGGIKVKKVNSAIKSSDLTAGTTNGRYYPLQVTTDGFGVINIPWVNTEYKAAEYITLKTEANGDKVFIHNKTATQNEDTNTTVTNKILKFGDQFNVFETGYDKYGHVQRHLVHSLTLPADTNSSHTHIVKDSANPIKLTDQTASNGTTGKVTYYLETLRNANIVNNPAQLNSSVILKPNHGESFSIPVITVDVYGRVTDLSSHIIQLPQVQAVTDTKVIQQDVTGNNGNNKDYPLLASAFPKSDFTTGRSRAAESILARTVSVNPYNGKITCTTLAQSSDYRLKENIKPFNYTKSILDLEVKSFDFIDGPKNQIGCMAQDLEKLYPELVVKGSDGYLAINETKLVYLLLEEVKILRDRLDTIEGK